MCNDFWNSFVKGINEMKLQEAIEKIRPIDQVAMEQAKERWYSIAIPLHSLGKLQDSVTRIAGIMRTNDVRLDKKALVVMCADNGVVEEGISQSGQEVTLIISENFLKEKATASIMCRTVGADIFPVDIGIAVDSKLIDRKVMYGTRNMAKEPAMTRGEVIRAIETGIAMVKELKDKGYGIIATGEMGIGNTTTSSAITAVLLEESVEKVTGRGAGLSSEGLERKIAVIKRAIDLHNPDKKDVIEVLSKVGGLDIAGMMGLFIGGGVYGVPIVIDGFISSVAALCAVRYCEAVKEYMLASHLSMEPASAMVLNALDIPGFLTCDMRLGEGTGAVMLYPILDVAVAVYNGMSTFEDNCMEEYVAYT